MNKTYIMLKDIPVLEIENYRCKILNYGLLPISLRYPDVNYDDVMHGWTENRTMNVGRTNAKKLLAGFRLSQSNPYMIARLFHFASLSDCYWMKEADEKISWKDVSLFTNSLEKAVSASALLGISTSFSPITEKLHTPELTVQGMSAKAWIREDGGLYLYKIGKKELAASKILAALDIPHVIYEKADEKKLTELADPARINKIQESNEEIVKCRIISSEGTSILPWEDFQMYCAYHDMDEFSYVKEHDGEAYYSMQVADYILGNEDRHGANFGFFMDNETGTLLHLYPLMDHDHAFSNEKDIPSQCSEENETLKEAAIKALAHVKIDFSGLLKMDKPEELTDEQWTGVVDRTGELFREQILEKCHNINHTFCFDDNCIVGTLSNGVTCIIQPQERRIDLQKDGWSDDTAMAAVLLDHEAYQEYQSINMALTDGQDSLCISRSDRVKER